MIDRACAVLITAGIAAAFAGCGNQIPENFAGSGVIEATEVTVSAETSGRLLSVGFDEGDMIAPGDLLAEIDVEQLNLQRAATANERENIDWTERTMTTQLATAREAIAQAAITLENVRTNYDRTTALHGDRAATDDQLDRAKTELDLAESRHRATQANLDQLTTGIESLQAKRDGIDASLAVLDRRIADGNLLSPVSGTVLERFHVAGEMVGPGTPVCRIADLSTVWLYVYVEEPDLGRIRLGGGAEIHVDSYPDSTFSGTITWISPEAEFTPKNVQTRDMRADLVYAVKVTLANPDGVFKIGMPADVYFEEM